MPAKKLLVSTYTQYILIALGFVLLIVFVRQVGGVLLTFLMATILAYALNPMVRRLERWRVPRIIAVLGIYAVLIMLVTGALMWLVIPTIGQVQAVVREPAALVGELGGVVRWAQRLPYVGQYVGEPLSTADRQQLIEFLQRNIPSAGQMLKVALGFIGGVFGVFGVFLNLVLMLIVSIYLLLDRERVLRATLDTIPVTVRDQVLDILLAVEGALVKYLKAQLTLCAIMGTVGFLIAFFVIGKYALVIGLWVGVMEILPVLGAFLAAIPAVVVALFLGGFSKALLVALLFLIAQQLEGNILVPRIMGGSVGVHPLWVLFAMLSATALYGVIGAFFAVPVVAIVSATLRYLNNTLIFEHWGKMPLRPVNEQPTEVEDARGEPEHGEPAAVKASAGKSDREAVPASVASEVEVSRSKEPGTIEREREKEVER